MLSVGKLSAQALHTSESGASHFGFFNVGMSGEMANHMMKQMKKFYHTKWNALA
jgi:hypothetical protein